ncbi:MAG: hypothetical protein ACT4O3_10455 [Elusimicrobiota bacterium]
MTPENLQKSLQDYVKICARKPGIERTLAVRRHVHQIRYSKKSFCVEFLFTRPPDGKLLQNRPASTAAPRAAAPLCPPARKRKEPGRLERSGSVSRCVVFANGDNSEAPPIIVPITFPNVSHEYWDHYSLTGELNVREGKAELQPSEV